MALLDFLKHKKQIEKSNRKKEAKPEQKAGEVKLEKEKIEKKPAFAKAQRIKGFSYEVVKKPHISEKGTLLSEKENQYIFEVLDSSNKTEIKKSIEGVYGVKVLSVNTIKIPAKKRRVGRTQGFKKGYAKAIVKLQKGDKIEIL